MSGRSFTRYRTLGAVAIAAAVIVSGFSLARAKARREHRRVALDILEATTQLKVYQRLNGFYPTTEQGPKALVEKPSSSPQPTRWHKLFSSLPKDPWGNDYVYRSPGRKGADSFDLLSPGPDHTPGTKDDDWGKQR
jgi:general secretion pathway protein G